MWVCGCVCVVFIVYLHHRSDSVCHRRRRRRRHLSLVLFLPLLVPVHFHIQIDTNVQKSKQLGAWVPQMTVDVFELQNRIHCIGGNAMEMMCWRQCERKEERTKIQEFDRCAPVSDVRQKFFHSISLFPSFCLDFMLYVCFSVAMPMLDSTVTQIQYAVTSMLSICERIWVQVLGACELRGNISIQFTIRSRSHLSTVAATYFHTVCLCVRVRVRKKERIQRTARIEYIVYSCHWKHVSHIISIVHSHISIYLYLWQKTKTIWIHGTIIVQTIEVKCHYSSELLFYSSSLFSLVVFLFTPFKRRHRKPSKFIAHKDIPIKIAKQFIRANVCMQCMDQFRNHLISKWCATDSINLDTNSEISFTIWIAIFFLCASIPLFFHIGIDCCGASLLLFRLQICTVGAGNRFKPNLFKQRVNVGAR